MRLARRLMPLPPLPTLDALVQSPPAACAETDLRAHVAHL